MTRIIIYYKYYNPDSEVINQPSILIDFSKRLESSIGIPVFMTQTISLSKPDDIILFMNFADAKRSLLQMDEADQIIANRMLVMSSHMKEVHYLENFFHPIGVFWGHDSFINKLEKKEHYWNFIGESAHVNNAINQSTLLLRNDTLSNGYQDILLDTEDPTPFICDYLKEYIKAYNELHSFVEDGKYISIEEERKPVIKYNFTFPGITPEKAKLMMQDKTTRINWLADKLSNVAQILSEECHLNINSLGKEGTSETLNIDASKEDFQNWINNISEQQTRLIILTLTGKKHESDFLCELVFELNDFLQNPSPEVPVIKYSVLSYPKENAQQPPKISFEKMIQNLGLKEA